MKYIACILSVIIIILASIKLTILLVPFLILPIWFMIMFIHYENLYYVNGKQVRLTKQEVKNLRRKNITVIKINFL